MGVDALVVMDVRDVRHVMDDNMAIFVVWGRHWEVLGTIVPVERR